MKWAITFLTLNEHFVWISECMEYCMVFNFRTKWKENSKSFQAHAAHVQTQAHEQTSKL